MASAGAQAGPSVPRAGLGTEGKMQGGEQLRSAPRWPQTEEEAAIEASLALEEGQRARRDAELSGSAAPREGGAALSVEDDKTTMTSSFQAGEQRHALEIAMSYINQGNEEAATRVSLRLSAIRIEGAKTLRSSFLSRLCRPYIDQELQDNPLNRLLYAHRLDHVMPGQKTSLPGLLALLQSVGTDMAALDVCADMNASLAPAKVAVPIGSEIQARPSLEDVDIVLQCREKPRYFFKTSTDVGNGEGNASIQARIRNVFGGAETADLTATTGTRTRRAYNASLSWPLFGFADHTACISALAQDRDLTAFSSATEGIRAARAGLRFENASTRGLHEIAYDLAHRHIGRLQPTASLSMRKLAGHSIKSSLVHTYTRDTRDDPFIASTGTLLKVSQEYAGLGGDANHYRLEGEAQISRPFFGPGDALSSAAVIERPQAFLGGYGFALAARAGILGSLNGQSPAFSDRFQLGGPTSIRMFRYNSLGPKDGLDALGGDAYYALGASLFAPPWPGKAHWPIKFHAFVNAGQLVQLHHGESASPTPPDTSLLQLAQRNAHVLYQDLLCKPSASAGVGIMFRQGGLRAELNVGVPLAVRKGDGARTGVQLGIGLSFL